MKEVQTVKIPGIGDVLEEADGTRWRVYGAKLDEGVEEDHPERKTLYLDVEPVKPRPPVPEAFRDALPVHDHGPEEGAGVACPEQRIGGRLVGECIVQREEADR